MPSFLKQEKPKYFSFPFPKCSDLCKRPMQKAGNWNRTGQDKKQCQEDKMVFSSILACHIDKRWRNTNRDKNSENLGDLHWRL